MSQGLLVATQCLAVCLEFVSQPLPSVLMFQASSLPPHLMDFPGGSVVKESACQCRRHRRRGFGPWVGKIPWRREWQPSPVFLPGKFHGQRSPASYSLWGLKESDVTEQVHFTCCLRKGCFCLPEPQEGGAPGSGVKKPVDLSWGESGQGVGDRS